METTSTEQSARRARKSRASEARTASSPAAPPRQTKSQQLKALLQRAEGASMAQLTAALDWLPHTVRAALSGLRKLGHTLERSPGGGGASVYRLTATD